MARFGKGILAILFVLLVVELIVILPDQVDVDSAEDGFSLQEKSDTRSLEQTIKGVPNRLFSF